MKTAVDMLISRLPNIDWTDSYYSDILNEAVDKEREQIVDAYCSGFRKGESSELIELDIDVCDTAYPIDYYNGKYEKPFDQKNGSY